MSQAGKAGPGTIRVGQFIGRLGVISLPAVQYGLDLNERVVRRHVAKLESSGWLTRAPWLWGDGSIAWLTAAGIQATGCGGLRPVGSPPGPTTINHGVLLGWTAAWCERVGHTWRSSRELTLDHDRWGIPVRGEHRQVTHLPDLAVWRPTDQRPTAVIAEHGGRRHDRQKAILQAWRDAITSGRYRAILYDCATQAIAQSLTHLATTIGLTSANFQARPQPTLEQIRALPDRSPTEAAPHPS